MTSLRSGNGGAGTQTSLVFQPGFPSPLPASGCWKPKGALIMMVEDNGPPPCRAPKATSDTTQAPPQSGRFAKSLPL